MIKLENLVLEARKGNIEAFNEIMNRFKGFIYKTSKEIYISGYDTDDLMQIGYMTLLKAVQKYDESKNKSFTAYAISAIKNNFYYEIRQKSKFNAESSLNKVIEDGIEIIENLASDENIEDMLLLKECSTEVREAVMQLSQEERELIYYIFFNDGKLKKFAEERNIKYVTCAKMKERTLKKLRKILNS